MNYGYKMCKMQVEEHDFWVAVSEDLKGCVGQGETQEEAIAELAINEQEWIETALECGITIPKCKIVKEQEYSGKVTLRLSKSMHEKAAECATREGVSLNSFFVEAISEKVGNSATNNVLKKLDLTIDKFAYVIGFAKPVLDTAVYFTQINSQSVNSFGYRKFQQYSLN